MVAEGATNYKDNIVETNSDGDFYAFSVLPLMKASGKYSSSGQLGQLWPINGDGTYT